MILGEVRSDFPVIFLLTLNLSYGIKVILR